MRVSKSKKNIKDVVFSGGLYFPYYVNKGDRGRSFFYRNDKSIVRFRERSLAEKYLENGGY